MDLEHILTDQPVDVDTKIAFLQNLKLVKLKLCEKFLILYSIHTDPFASFKHAFASSVNGLLQTSIGKFT